MTQRRKQLRFLIEIPGDDDIFSYAVTPDGCRPEAVVVKIRNTTALETPRAATFLGNDTIFIMIFRFALPSFLQVVSGNLSPIVFCFVVVEVGNPF